MKNKYISHKLEERLIPHRETLLMHETKLEMKKLFDLNLQTITEELVHALRLITPKNYLYGLKYLKNETNYSWFCYKVECLLKEFKC